MVLLYALEDLPLAVANLSEPIRKPIAAGSLCGLLLVLYYIACLLYKLIQGFNLYILSQISWRRPSFVARYGQWAVITGGSDGIGLGLAREFAKSGMSILIISRSAEKLASAKALLKREENVGEVETIQADLADTSKENFDKIRAKVKPLARDIGILINNAATLPYKMACFLEYEMGSTEKLVSLNVLSVVQMTQMILPGMLERERGLIVNVSSLSGSIPLPYYSLYGPTKVALSAFTRQLQIEYQSHPIDFVLLEPGPVRTKLADPDGSKKGPSIFFPKPDAYSRSAVRALAARPSFYSGTLGHGIFRETMLLSTKLGLTPLVCRILKRQQEDIDLTTLANLDPQRARGGVRDTPAKSKRVV